MNAAFESNRTPTPVNALRAVSQALRPVHGALLDATRLQYEETHEPVKSRGALLQLALNDDSFSWLRPLSDLMVRVDTLADQPEIDPLEVLALHAAVESWALLSEEPHEGFQSRYVTLLQQRPDLVMAHSQLRFAVQQLEAAASPLARPLFSASSLRYGGVGFA